MGFEAEWLAARSPYDEAALDPSAIGSLRAWASTLPDDALLTVVDLGSGTGAALARVRRWLAPSRIVAYGVDRDAALLAQVPPDDSAGPARLLVGDLLEPLDLRGGPSDGTVDLVVAHALADLLPLDRLAARIGALLRPGGLAHVALAYDGLTAFATGEDADPNVDAALDAAVLSAFHAHMDLVRRGVPSYGGSTAGRRLGPALAEAGLEIVSDAPSVWNVRAADGPRGCRVLERLIRFVTDTVPQIGTVPARELRRWEARQRAALAAGTLVARVGHRDVLARKPDQREDATHHR